MAKLEGGTFCLWLHFRVKSCAHFECRPPHLRDIHSVAAAAGRYDDPRLRAEVGRVGREGLPAEGGVVLDERPVALNEQPG